MLPRAQLFFLQLLQVLLNNRSEEDKEEELL
jgi:hypothetical protein